MKKRPIGVFDSGFGGLTVVRELNKLLPNEDVVYFGDTAHLPYGPKSKETIIKYSSQICTFLKKKNVKLIVIACNTASSFAINSIKKKFKIPVIGVILPGAKKACNVSKNSRIGVIGTKGTIASLAYNKAIAKFNKKAKVISQPCPLFVPLVEEGWHNSKTAYDISRIYLKDFKNSKIESLILGCTHYPLLKKTIASVINNKNVNIIDSAHEVALAASRKLDSLNLLENKGSGKLKFFVSDDPGKFKVFGEKFLGKKIYKVTKV